MIRFGESVIYTSIFLQNFIALSSIEAEYSALVGALKKIQQLHTVILEFNIPKQIMKV